MGSINVKTVAAVDPGNEFFNQLIVKWHSSAAIGAVQMVVI